VKRKFWLNEKVYGDEGWTEVSEDEFVKAVHVAGFNSGIFHGTSTKYFSTDKQVQYKRGKTTE